MGWTERTEITVEEVLSEAKIQNSTGLVWDFHFKNVSSFVFSVDCVMGFWIMEVGKGNMENEIEFNLDQGYINVIAEYIELGIPSPKKDNVMGGVVR